MWPSSVKCFNVHPLPLLSGTEQVSLKGIAWYSGKCAYSLSDGELEEKADKVRICLYGKYETTAQRLETEGHNLALTTVQT